MSGKPIFFRHGQRGTTCRPGAPIRSLGALVRHLEREPSVWWSTAGKAMPSTVVGNWQLRQIVRMIRVCSFRRVIRPKRATFEGCPL